MKIIVSLIGFVSMVMGIILTKIAIDSVPHLTNLLNLGMLSFNTFVSNILVLILGIIIFSAGLVIFTLGLEK